jgi:hypothetical protein
MKSSMIIKKKELNKDRWPTINGGLDQDKGKIQIWYFWREKFNFLYIFWGYHQEFFGKIIFRQKYPNDMSIDSVFDGDYESAIVFYENISMKNENRTVWVHFSI